MSNMLNLDLGSQLLLFIQKVYHVSVPIRLCITHFVARV